MDWHGNALVRKGRKRGPLHTTERRSRPLLVVSHSPKVTVEKLWQVDSEEIGKIARVNREDVAVRIANRRRRKHREKVTIQGLWQIDCEECGKVARVSVKESALQTADRHCRRKHRGIGGIGGQPRGVRPAAAQD